MTISTEQLLKLISGMTDQKPDIVLKEWETLVESVRNLKPGESVEMSQLGTFKNVNGDIEFDPNGELADEINYEYSGQEPVVIEEGEEGSTTPIGMSVSGDDDDNEKDDTASTDDEDDVFGVGDSDESEDEATDDEFVNPFARPGAEPLFPDVDEVARKIKEEEDAEEAAKEAEKQDEIFGLDDEEAEIIDDAEESDEPITMTKKGPEEPEDAVFDEDEDDALTNSDANQTGEKSLYESLESPDDDKTEEEKPAAMVIPPVKPDEKVVEELKAEEEAAEAEAMARKIEKEQGKREKAKQVKKFNVWVAPKKTKSSPDPKQVAKMAGGIFLVILVIGGLIWYVLSILGSGDRPVATQSSVQPAPPVEQPVTEVPPAAEEEIITEEVTPQDATEPAPADQTQEQPVAEQVPEPETVSEPVQETTPAPAPPVAAETATGEYGLEGEIVNVPGRSYGIVVHSLSNQSRAQQEEANLREMGYRVRIISFEQDGQTFYRVSVGQFETPEAAVEAGQQLPEPYRSNFFIRRFFP